jgi:hypothetical protein
MSPLNLHSLVSTILSASRPILLLDTCVYLDFLNKAFEPQSPYGLKNILEMNDAGTIYIVAPELIVEEFARNAPNVLDRANRALDRVFEEVEAIRAHLEAFAALDKSDKPPLYLTGRTVTRSVNIVAAKVQQLIDSITLFELTPESKLRAHDRQRKAARPARRGKDSLGDCSITEGLLELARKLRSDGFTERIVFVSSNVDDFGDEEAFKRRFLHPALQIEFEPLHIEFFSNINDAVSTFHP